MPRAGSGGGGGHRSGGGHSSHRSGGGHRVGGGHSRAGSGSFGGVRSSSRGGYGGPGGGFRGDPGMPPPPPRPPRRHYGYHGGYGTVRTGGSGGGCFSSIVSVLVVFFLIAVMYATFTNNFGGVQETSSTIERHKLETNNGYMNSCIEDEIGWFDSVSRTETRLKDFWEETGVQPYIILKDYDPSLISDADKDRWCEEFYDTYFDREDIFLYVYFAEEDVDNEVGYMAYINGKQVGSVMDSEAVEIFFNYIDKYWFTNMSTDDLFVKTFNDTAKTIMRVSTTGKDVALWVFIAVAVIAAGFVIINVMKQKNARAKQKAEEDAKILNTPIHDMAEDELTNKYL